jgi:Flp pilus assembly pilin Flp
MSVLACCQQLLLTADRVDIVKFLRLSEDGRRIEPWDRGANMIRTLRELWRHDDGQDIAEYAVMLAVILVLVVGTVRLIGSNANNAFSNAASSIQ